MGLFFDAQKSLKLALEEATAVLEVKAPQILAPHNPEGADLAADPGLELIRKRKALVALAMSSSPDHAASEKLRDECEADSYLRELQPLLADCMTFGELQYQRKTVLDLCLVGCA